MRRFLDILGAKWLTPVLIVPVAVAYVVRLVMSGGQIIMLSQGFDVLTGGADIPHLILDSPLIGGYAVLLLAHSLARILLTVVAESRLPKPAEVDVEEILARSDAYTVAVVAPGWVERVAGEVPGSWYIADDAGDRAVVWRGPRPVVRRAWRIALWLVFAGMLLSIMTRESISLRLGDGEVVSAPIEAELYRYDWRFPAPGVKARLPESILGVIEGGVRPSIDPAGAPIPDALFSRPVVAETVFGEQDSLERPVRMWPPTIINGRFVTITELGVAPHVVVVKDDQPVLDRYAKPLLVGDLYPTASLAFEELPFSLQLTVPSGVALVPSAVFAAQALAGTETVVASGTVGAQRALDVDGYRVTIPDTRWWVGLSVVTDPGLWVVIAAMVILVLSLLVRVWVVFAGNERYELAVVSTEQGERLYIGADASLLARGRARGRLRRLAEAAGRAEESDTLSSTDPESTTRSAT